MPDARPLVLAFALEAAPMGAVRLMRARSQKSAYVATLVVDPNTTPRPWTIPPEALNGESPVECTSRV